MGHLLLENFFEDGLDALADSSQTRSVARTASEETMTNPYRKHALTENARSIHPKFIARD
jgi:hypothetical protein